MVDYCIVNDDDYSGDNDYNDDDYDDVNDYNDDYSGDNDYNADDDDDGDDYNDDDDNEGEEPAHGGVHRVRGGRQRRGGSSSVNLLQRHHSTYRQHW